MFSLLVTMLILSSFTITKVKFFNTILHMQTDQIVVFRSNALVSKNNGILNFKVRKDH